MVPVPHGHITHYNYSISISFDSEQCIDKYKVHKQIVVEKVCECLIYTAYKSHLYNILFLCKKLLLIYFPNNLGSWLNKDETLPISVSISHPTILSLQMLTKSDRK